jgi:hypothetical protein
LSCLLALVGAWLALPWLTSLFQRPLLPASGVPLVVEWYEMARMDLIFWLSDILDSLVSFQEGLATGLETTAWIGLIILTLGSLLALDQFLPRAGMD